MAGDKPTLRQRQQQQFSAAAAAARIRYADPRTLPSFPSSGLASNGAAASAAATLGWANQKSVDPWKPDRASSASAAAALASDYKMAPSPQSPANSDGHKAALLAVGSAGAALKQSNAAKPSSNLHDSWGNSAATQAFHANRPASAEPPNLTHGSSAATQAFNIGRSMSTTKAPWPPNDKSSLTTANDSVRTRQRASSNALDGATRAHRASMQAKLPTEEAGAVSVVTMTRNMFTSAPPVQPEADERSNNERLHQSAVEMAKKMYSQHQKMAHQTKSAQTGQSEVDQVSPYLNLQDAAYKQAQERLAKLHNEHMKSREYQEYYGNEKVPRHKLSVAAKLRRRLSDSDSLGDRQRSREIREQMSMFSNKLSQVDKDKREKDREALLAAAQRNVKARLQTMDEKTYRDKGRLSPTRLTEWEVKAQQAAQSRHDSRTENKGKVDIGGGKFMAREEVDAIAIKRVQPVLDNINEKAGAERERQAVLRMEEEARREEGEKQKAREREVKEIQKQVKEQEKQEERARKQQEKQDEKTAKAEERRHAKEDNHKLKHETAAVGQQHNEEHTGDVEGSTRQDEALGSNPPGRRPTTESDGESPGTAQRKSEMPTSPTSKVKGWIKNRFSRGKSLSEYGDKRRSFFGGAAMKEHEANKSTTSLDKRPTGFRDVVMTAKAEPADDNEARGAASGFHKKAGGGHSERDSHGVSPASTPLEEEERRLGDDSGGQDGSPTSLEPPRPIDDGGKRVSSSPTRDSRFREMIDR
ncbi:eisosome protein 1 domain-containing protein [Hirsutella rhossiliensis]|uniref:Eisosome protein 1 domain-containing protein n=1 Tax=Hirsutella rhossiliensis TaxID=111463 RepID=A0A9P8N0Y5_9HYPO|nr:eisosome protein 1 domain-containing protein [Hirsutella rhossiliensis]KAH0964839.1 eisosome protein 1 domain-containing protein [Hirsutella rhossiliensis]